MIGEDIEIRNCGSRGIYNSQIRGERVVVVDTAGPGIVTHRVSLKDSTISGNDVAGAGVDLRSDRMPRLRNTDYGRSRHGESGSPFGVCQND